MAYVRPTVLEGVSQPAFVQYLLDKHEGPASLLVCGTKQAFAEDLRAAATAREARDDAGSSQPHLDEQRATSTIEASRQAQQLWNIPTLRSLATSRTVEVAFCPDITHLRAYLATYITRISGSGDIIAAEDSSGQRILAILNLVQLHRPTSAFSAQGLNRTFSAAIEAAYHTQSQLIIAECPADAPMPVIDHVVDLSDEQPPQRLAAQSLWDEEVSILNVTTKSFGAGERGWVGRTVKLRTIAERWCTFETLPCQPEAG